LKNVDLIDTDAIDYPFTRAWAEALYERNPDAQGLYWTSRQENRAQALMLFGPRVDPPTFLRPIGAPKRLREVDGTIDLELLRLARKIDVDLAK
jgi:RES domain